jgi:putative redox protein
MEIPLKSVSAKVTGDINLSGFVGVGEKIGFSNIDVEISLDAPDATDEQLNTLKGAVDAHCPLVASLVNPLDLTTNLVKAEPAGSTNPSDNLKEGVMALVSAAKEDGDALKMQYGSTSILNGTGLKTTATITGGHTLVVDEPTTMPGGTNEGTNPIDLYCAAFGTCQEITYKYYSQVMGLDVQSVSCKVEAPIDLGGLVGLADDAVGLKSMTGTITVESNATQEQLDQLKAACDAHCPLVDTYKGKTPVSLSWKRAGGSKK